jgi:hypothetical protein
VLFGLTHGVDSMDDALVVEREVLTTDFGIGREDFFFVDGSGGGFTTATTVAVIRMLEDMSKRPSFPAYRDALPILGVDGSLALVTDFEADPGRRQREGAGQDGDLRRRHGDGPHLQGTGACGLHRGEEWQASRVRNGGERRGSAVQHRRGSRCVPGPRDDLSHRLERQLTPFARYETSAGQAADDSLGRAVSAVACWRRRALTALSRGREFANTI